MGAKVSKANAVQYTLVLMKNDLELVQDLGLVEKTDELIKSTMTSMVEHAKILPDPKGLDLAIKGYIKTQEWKSMNVESMLEDIHAAINAIQTSNFLDKSNALHNEYSDKFKIYKAYTTSMGKSAAEFVKNAASATSASAGGRKKKVVPKRKVTAKKA